MCHGALPVSRKQSCRPHRNFEVQQDIYDPIYPIFDSSEMVKRSEKESRQLTLIHQRATQSGICRKRCFNLPEIIHDL